MTFPPPTTGAECWTGLTGAALPVELARDFLAAPDCGAVVVFTGNARDHAPGRPGVERLEYEAYDDMVLPRLAAIDGELRSRWPSIRRTVLWHRVGVVPVGEEAVVVGVSSPHRAAAFDAARFGIDALKATVPIWKRETWSGGDGWGLEAQHLVDAVDVGSPADAGGGDDGVHPLSGGSNVS